jgi:hypothetical protein
VTADDMGQPGRPYSGPDQLGGNAPRGEQFRTGANQTGDIATATARPDAGLTDDSLQFRAMTPKGYRPSSVLTPIGSNNNPGGLGMSAGDAAKRLPDGTFLGPGNGMAASSFEPSALLKLAGQNSQ